MTFDDLSPELREKALACKTPEDLIKLAQEEGVDLNDEQLQAISGGHEWSCSDKKCEDYERDPW